MAPGSPSLDFSPGRFVAAATYLDTLNAEQRRAVEHGVADGGTVGGPLLVIAGAGSGKTNTLAHRVAHLIVAGSDPRRILLMTFSRRAAAEMAARVERIARKVLGESNAAIMRDALSWAGTFHGIGARLLREYSERIGAGDDQVGDAVGQRVGLAGACAGNDEQRAPAGRAVSHTMLDRAALLGIERIQICRSRHESPR